MISPHILDAACYLRPFKQSNLSFEQYKEAYKNKTAYEAKPVKINDSEVTWVCVEEPLK